MLKVIDALPDTYADTVDGVAERLLIDPEIDLLSRRTSADEVSDPVMSEIRRAVLDGHRLRIRYAAVDRPARWRTVDPIGLVMVRDKGYLLAGVGGADRTYRLSRVLAAERLAEPAERPARIALDRAWQDRSTRFRSGGDQVVVLARVDPTVRQMLVDTVLAVLTEEPERDGWLRLEVALQDQRHAEWALWQLGAGAQVLAPAWLRSTLRDRAAAVTTLYGPPGRRRSAP